MEDETNLRAIFKEDFSRPLPLNPLPELKPRSETLPHAPVRRPGLNHEEKKQAIKNALRYFPE